MAVNLSPIWGAGAQLFDNSGNVLSGGKIYTYAAGTTTPATTYTSSSGITANSNPIILNSAGRVPYEIWLSDTLAYKFVLKDSNDTLIATYDNLVGINSNFIAYTAQQEIQTATAGQTVFNLTTMQYQPGTHNLSVFVDGVNQYGPGAQYAYVETDSDTVTFVNGLHVGASVKFTTASPVAGAVMNAVNVAYDPPFTGAVGTNVEDKLSEVISAADFGDVDGIGTITLNVPADYGTIQDALDFLASKTIVSGTTVKIQVANGTYTYVSAVYLNHPQGDQIEIVGNETTPSSCVIEFSTSDGFYLPSGYKLGKLNGIRLVNTTVKSSTTPYLGILTDGGAYLQVGPKIEVHNFYYGIAARNGGYINAGGTSTNYVKVTDAGDVGIWSFIGSYVNCEYAEVSGTDDSVNGLGGGIVAEFDSGIQANYAHTHNNWLCGISSLSSSSVRAFNTNVHNNQFGYMTFSNGSIEIYSSTVTNNSIYGYQSLSGGQVLGWETCTESGNNTFDGFSYRASFYQAPDGYNAILNTGNLTIAGDGPQAGSAGDAYFDLRAKTGKDAIQRYLINGVEKVRHQYFDVNNTWTLGGNSKTAMTFAPLTGRVNIGVGGPSTSATTGFLQIPSCAGAPSGTVTDNQAGFVPIVYDWVNNRLYVYNGGWVKVALTT